MATRKRTAPTQGTLPLEGATLSSAAPTPAAPKTRASRKKPSLRPTGEATRTRRSRRREAELAFDTLTIEGGLLAPEWLARVAQLEAEQQSEADYGVEEGLALRDELGRYWRMAQAKHRAWQLALGGAGDPWQLTEHFLGELLTKCFGFTSLVPVEPRVLDGRPFPIGHAALDGRVPVVLAPARGGLDHLESRFGDGTRRRSAFGLAQEYLNAQEGALWGLASDGATLRILRDNASLTRPAWIDVDLDRLFSEERFADFAALWLLCHESRFGKPGQRVEDCPLEAWRSQGRAEGTRAREQLRAGVEQALEVLGQGFLDHGENVALRAALASGELTTSAYFSELLRLVYRLIFLLTVEERELLHPPETSDAARKLYAEGYALRRLRERAVRRSAQDRFADLWESLKITFRGLGRGEPLLGLPALAGIFTPGQCPHFDGARLENRGLLLALFHLAWLRESTGLSRVNWRDMGPEELGSVYESLLELVPQLTDGARRFAFARGDETRGNARKTTGSYYTPDSLVQVLLESALDPVLEETIARHPEAPAAALLELSIVDPACGSGHFLLAAARRLAAQVARLQSEGTPSAAEYRHALRQVVGRCIFGVDLNPMAVELCKVSLWMEAVDPGLPLSFLDSHVQRGNALLGTTPELMKEGLPDAAWDPLEGDDKKASSALKKRNKLHGNVEQQAWDFVGPAPAASAEQLTAAVKALEACDDDSAEALAAKESRWSELLRSPAFVREKLVADAWCSGFVWPKQPGAASDAAPTNELWRQLQRSTTAPPELTLRTVEELTQQYAFFHWHLQFPQVFAKGGFDVVLGNPPWERVKLQEQEFFASRSVEIATAENASLRKKLIARLPDEDPTLWTAWCAASRQAEGESQALRRSGRYPLCGKGDVNTYALFAEHNRAILSPRGRAGFIVPTGIATDDTTKEFFGTLVREKELSTFFSFENEEKVFPGVHNQFKFALMCLDGAGQSAVSDLLFFARQACDLSDRNRRFSLTAADFTSINPNTGTCPTFRSRRDADLNLALYRRAGILWRESDGEAGNPWGLRFLAMLHMANDSGLFRTRAELEAAGQALQGSAFTGPAGRSLPLLEAKMLHQFDHRFSTYENATQANLNKGTLPRLDDLAHASPSRVGMPEYWVPSHEVDGRLSDRWERGWLLGWRDITRSVDERTVIASLIPRVASGDTFLLAMPTASPTTIAALFANLCSFVLDYCARQKVGGTHIKYHTFKQLPVLAPCVYEPAAPWDHGQVIVDWLLPRVVELTYTAWDLEAFGRDVGYAGPPFRWDPERRFLLRCELDAAFFHLYGLARDDVDYILDTFPIVRRHDEKAHGGKFRTKDTILDIFDELALATRTGRAYVTRLDPPPADPRVAHGEETRPEWAVAGAAQ